MDVRTFFSQYKKKIIYFGFALAAFAAGFAFSVFAKTSILGYLNNTPKLAEKQYGASAEGGGGGLAEKTDPNCQIKGKATKKGKKIYYYPGSLFYGKVKNPQCFDSEEAAQQAGYVRSTH